MNNKGQVFALFVIMLPIFLLLIYFVGSRIYLYNEKKSQEKIADLMCEQYKKEKDIKKIIELGNKNDYKQEIEINKKDNKIEIVLIKEIKDIINKKNKVKTNIICE